MSSDKKHIKYPRTPHLSFSPGATSDDRFIHDMSMLISGEIVITEKMDGENTSIYSDGSHARSLDSGHHASRDMIKALQARIAHDIPEGWRLCGENVLARHSISYESLPSSFLLFSVWDERNVCLSWDATVEWAELLGIHTVPVLYRGPWDETAVRACFTGESRFGTYQEGYVVRRACSFHMDLFRSSVAKFVRANHVQTDKHWMQQAMIKNGMA